MYMLDMCVGWGDFYGACLRNEHPARVHSHTVRVGHHRCQRSPLPQTPRTTHTRLGKPTIFGRLRRLDTRCPMTRYRGKTYPFGQPRRRHVACHLQRYYYRYYRCRLRLSDRYSTVQYGGFIAFPLLSRTSLAHGGVPLCPVTYRAGGGRCLSYLHPTASRIAAFAACQGRRSATTRGEHLVSRIPHETGVAVTLVRHLRHRCTRTGRFLLLAVVVAGLYAGCPGCAARPRRAFCRFRVLL